MKQIVGISFIIMLYCFNIGLLVVSQSGLYTLSQEGQSSEEMGAMNMAAVAGIGVMTLAGGVIGYGLSIIARADTWKTIGITVLFVNVFPLLRNSYHTLSSFGSEFGGMYQTMITIFIGFQAVMILIFIIQLATGGWQSNV